MDCAISHRRVPRVSVGLLSTPAREGGGSAKGVARNSVCDLITNDWAKTMAKTKRAEEGANKANELLAVGVCAPRAAGRAAAQPASGGNDD